MTSTSKGHIVKRVAIIISIILAACAVAVGILRIVQLNFLYTGWVFTGAGFYFGDGIEDITNKDLAVVEKVLDDNHISHKLNEDDKIVLVQGYNEKKAIKLLQSCEYEFEGCVLDH